MKLYRLCLTGILLGLTAIMILGCNVDDDSQTEFGCGGNEQGTDTDASGTDTGDTADDTDTQNTTSDSDTDTADSDTGDDTATDDGSSQTDTDTAAETDCGSLDQETQFCDSRDGTVYAKITIGSQVWMAENLNYGTMVAGSNEQNNNVSVEKYCGKDNADYCDYYGGLYQWAEVMGIDNAYNTASYLVDGNHQGICPPGWHIPTKSEWRTLSSYVSKNGSETCPEDSNEKTDNCTGYDLKSAETDSWATNPQTGAGGPGSDLFGFTGLGGGGRYYSGYVSGKGDPDPDNYFGWTAKDAGGKGYRGIFYTATESDDSTATVFHLGDDVNSLGSDADPKIYGFSVRCVED